MKEARRLGEDDVAGVIASSKNESAITVWRAEFPWYMPFYIVGKEISLEDVRLALEKMPDRFMIGVDAAAPRLFEPVMLDRLFTWTRRILGELKPDVAARVAHRNAVKLYRIE